MHYFTQPAKKENYLFIAILILSTPALLIHLGLLPFIEDEAVRALVAHEMIIKKDFITPTLAGEWYFKKPPLYNWIIALFFLITGKSNEFVTRLPMILSLMGLTITVFYFVRKRLNARVALFASVMTLTCGRVLIYESLHGLIDITYSWFIFFFFMKIYEEFRKGRMLYLFLYAYIIVAITFLMKGLPSIAFLGISLLVLFTWKGRIKQLLSWQHALGMVLFMVIVGSYYLSYIYKNGVTPEEIFSIMLDESNRRTVVAHGIKKTLLHLVSYPFENIFHFLPWTLLTILFFIKGAWKKIKANEFVFFTLLIFFFNIIIYWVSPDSFPRYILMLIPLWFISLGYLYQEYVGKSKILTYLEWIFGGIFIIVTLGFFVAPFYPITKDVPWIAVKTGTVILALTFLCVLYFRKPTYRLVWLGMLLLVFRIGFNWTILPHRYATMEKQEGKEEALRLADAVGENTLYLYWNNQREPTYYHGKCMVTYDFVFYTAVKLDTIIPIREDLMPGKLYLVYPGDFDGKTMEKIDEFKSAYYPANFLVRKKQPG